MDLLRYYEYVLAVADEGSFTDAARELGITQPPLSQGVRRLEERWGVRLFERGARGVHVSPEGRRLLPTMRALVAESQALDHRARHLGRVVPHLGFGVDTGIACFADRVAARLRQVLHRGLGPRTGLPAELVDAVRAGDLDVAIVQHPCATDGVLTGGPLTLATNLLVPAATGSTPNAEGGVAVGGHRVPVDLPLALRPRSEVPAAHDLLLHEALRAGHDGEVREVPAAQIRTWVSAGAAWTIVPTSCSEGVDGAGPGVEMFPAPPRLRLRAAVVAGSQDLLDQVHEIARDLAVDDA